MKRNNAIARGTAALLLLSCAAGAQKMRLTARDAFWSASDLISVTPNPAAHARARHAERSHSAAAHPVTSAPSAAAQEAEATPPSRQGATLKLVSENGYGAAPHLVRSADNRLGLRCSVLLRGSDDQYKEVAPNTVFHSGDHIKLSLLANEPGYLYVIEQGSSGKWSLVFPSPRMGVNSAKIEAGQLDMVPNGRPSFLFNDQPGDEKLFVILSRAPIPDMDRVIDNLKGGNAEPTAAPAQQSPAPMLEAENHIPDIFVQQLASRDLLLVDEQTVDQPAASGGEKAIYAVSKENGTSDDSRVVLKLDLRHE